MNILWRNSALLDGNSTHLGYHGKRKPGFYLYSNIQLKSNNLIQLELSTFPGYFTRTEPGGGCQSCGCNSFGSLPQTKSLCDTITGQCQCKQGNSGITGLNCDECQEGFFNFSQSAGRYMFSKVSNPYKTLILLQSLLDCQLNFNNYSQDVPNTCR